MKYNKMLIAIDSSEFSFKAALKAMDFAKEYKAEVGLIYVVEILQSVSSPELGYMAAEVIQRTKSEAEDVLDKLINAHGIPKSEVSRFVPEGNTWQRIIETAESWGADVIALGTHGRTGFLHLLMGSIAESVVQHSKIPVMVFPAKFVNPSEDK